MTFWQLWLDYHLDSKEIPHGFIGASSSQAAINLVKLKGPPNVMHANYNLIGADNVMKVLEYLKENYPNNIPCYSSHSTNFTDNIRIDLFMRNWNKDNIST